MTPRAWAGTINNNAAEADAVVRVVNAPSVNSSLGVIIDSHAVTNIENKGNRQFPQVGMLGGPAPTSYFGDWKTGPDEWNVFPTNWEETWVKTGETEKIKYYKISKRIYKSYPKTDKITIVGPGQVRGKKVGWMSVVVNEDQCTKDAEEIAKSEGMANGATHMEVWASSSLRIPKSSGWHVGTGVGASGVIGEDEKGGISGAGGTGFGVSRLEAETFPFVKVQFLRNGADGENVSSVVSTSQDEKPKELSLPKKAEAIK
ncbi:hypothetical protein KKH38_00710 [Patescibacteria group bacterium]|nr:hypothetical protein [Patescibacteria group bacterium]MBU4600981.1 hypothetical protein [Patescibacteria group bacterium]MCG2697607.1 hypothetical protein [Candidatus Parcubacteria bacterium]